jgi:hypothetical protein
MSLEDQSRPGKGGSEKTSTVATMLSPAADTDAAWFRAAMVAVKALASSGIEFTSDDLSELVGPAPRGRALSTVFAIARRRYLIRPIGAVISRAGRPVRRWVGDQR